MPKTLLISLLACFIIAVFSPHAYAQEAEDSFFLSKKRGLLGRLGKSVSISGKEIQPVKLVNRYKRFSGMIVRNIIIVPLGFGKTDESDSSKLTFPEKVAHSLHRNSISHLINNNLFFSRGEILSPLLIADNERYLRDLPYLQDARIEVRQERGTDSVDILVVTHDVFSIGGSVSASSSRLRLELKEENLAGRGNKLSVSTIIDKNRSPGGGFGAEFIKRNIKGRFINFTAGFSSFNNTFNTGRYEENTVYTLLEKPMITRYTQWTGAAELSYNKSFNGYADTLYESDFKYRYIRTDFWAGYNIGYKSGRLKDSEQRLRHFVAARKLYNHFYDVPAKFETVYNYNYADLNATLFSYSLYRQNFYRTNFIYGFGRYEDVPEGVNASVVAGFTNKQEIKRAYYGLDIDFSSYNKRDHFSAYTFKVGGFVNKRTWQDVDILLGVNRITRLRSLSNWWLNRNFVNIAIAGQLKPFLNTPLLLESNFGLPYFKNGTNEADFRATAKLESVFFHLRTFLGFRFAPFIFSDVTLLKPIHESLAKSNGYSALGAGVRTRNENLVFGTIELKGYVFPRVTPGMQNWKVEISTNVRFKYNSSFIRRPDFILVN
ncbi:MAG: hypothetical protein ABIY51_07750 [Ferruginibacter sp.]